MIRALAILLALSPLVAHAAGDPPPADTPAPPPADAPPPAPPAAEPAPEPASEPTSEPAPEATSEPAPEATSEPAPETTSEAAPDNAEIEADIDDLYDKLERLERAQRKNESTRAQVNTLMPLSRYINVFVDVGAFAVGGDGSGIRPDLGHLYFPQYDGHVGAEWVFMGDPLSTAINSLGEPSDTATSRAIEHDTINSEGRPSLIVNSVGLSISRYVGKGISVSSLALLLPRPDDTTVDVELATISYRPLDDVNLVLEAGKIDSVLGVEYRVQDATRRTGVTPSLIWRYTSGRPLGVRAHLEQGRLSASATLANGNNFRQIFEHDALFQTNRLPTLSSHLQWKLPVGQSLELGISGAIGPQDGAPELIAQWHYGVDLRLIDFHDFDVTAEYVQGKQPGKTESMVECDVAPCLHYKGAYVLVDRYVTPALIPYFRVDWRSAVHINGTQFVYESHTLRTTVGAQLRMTSRIIGKLEYTYNRELGGIPQFPDDVLTTSLVVKTD